MDDLRKRSDVVGTPEGDSEFAPDQPMEPAQVEADVDGLQKWPSNSAMEYDKDASGPEDDDKRRDEASDMKRVIDELGWGKILP